MEKNSGLIRFSQGALISTAGIILGGIFSYLTRKFLLLQLSATEYGFFYSVFSLASLGLALSDLGLGRATTLLMAKSAAGRNLIQMQRHFNLGFWFRAVGGSFLAILFFVAASFFFRQENSLAGSTQLLLIMSIFLPLQSLSGLCIGSFDALQQFTTRNIFQTLYYLLVMTAVLIGFLLPPKLLVPAFAYLIAALISVVIGYCILKKIGLKVSFKPRFFLSVWRENWAYVKWISLSVMAINTMNYLDTIMLSKIAGITSAADYQVALPVAQIGRSFIVLPVIFTPLATDLWHQNRADEIARICRLLTLVMLFSLGLIAMFLLPLGGDVLALLFDEQYRAVSTTLLILGCGMPILIIAEFYLNTLNAIEKPAIAATVAIVGMLANVVFNLMFIPEFGPSGAALATLLSYLIISGITYVCLNRYVLLKIPATVFILSLPVILYFICFYSRKVTSFGTFVLVVVYLGIGLIVGSQEFAGLVKKA